MSHVKAEEIPVLNNFDRAKTAGSKVPGPWIGGGRDALPPAIATGQSRAPSYSGSGDKDRDYELHLVFFLKIWEEKVALLLLRHARWTKTTHPHARPPSLPSNHL